jgi:hypothetical protein
VAALYRRPLLAATGRLMAHSRLPAIDDRPPDDDLDRLPV